MINLCKNIISYNNFCEKKKINQQTKQMKEKERDKITPNKESI